MGVGGSFDVISGKTKRAPVWMQKLGLEWFYRVSQEPGRLWKRYLMTNSAFVYLIMKEKFALKNN
jgi:N-acetylglucosaminyldiphosphoundecaprenol N-acetyl-beta-D-mannosaminyltransferase